MSIGVQMTQSLMWLRPIKIGWLLIIIINPVSVYFLINCYRIKDISQQKGYLSLLVLCVDLQFAADTYSKHNGIS